MAVGQELKKLKKQLSHNRAGAGDHFSEKELLPLDLRRQTEYVPQNWSAYVLMFSTVSIFVFGFLLFDPNSSPPSLLLSTSRERLGSLRAQVGDAYLFTGYGSSSNASGPSSSSVNVRVSKRNDGEGSKSVRKDKLEIEFLSESRGKPQVTGGDASKRKSSETVGLDSEVGGERPPSAQKRRSETTRSERKSPRQVRDLDSELAEQRTFSTQDKKSETGRSVSSQKDLDGIDLAREDSKAQSESEIEKSTVVEKKSGYEGESKVKSKSETKKDIVPERTSENEREEKSGNSKQANDGVEEIKEAGSLSLIGVTTELRKGVTNENEALKKKQEKEALVDKFTAVIHNDTCDFSRGKWIYDENYPLYAPNTCPYIDSGFRCVENGRPSVEFQKWRWRPTGCHLPRFDAMKMLRRLRNLRLAFVGDSLGRNSWESMLCMLAEAVPNKTRVYPLKGQNITKYVGSVSFRFEDYNFTLEYYRSVFLVLHDEPPPGADSKIQTTLKLDQIDNSSRTWNSADIVVFNSGHWWTSEKTISSGRYFQKKQTLHEDMTVRDAFRTAMNTVARFVETSMDPDRTQVFFMSYAPHHFKGGTWDEGGTCNDDVKPIKKFPFVYEDKTSNNMILDVIGSNVRNPITFLNITYISELRPDGHNSIWRTFPPLPKDIQDCSHWCLPGVPETWNEILFATLLRIGKGSWASKRVTVKTAVTSKS